MASLSKGTIYRIHSESEDKEYIGSTIMKLSERLSSHKSDYRKWLVDKDESYYSSYEILKTDDYTVDVLEEVEVESKQELRQIERQWYDRRVETVGRDRVVNKIRPYISVEEDKERKIEYGIKYRTDNKEKHLEYFKEFRTKNKDKIILRQSQKIHCKYCDSEMRKDSVSEHNKTIKHIKNFIQY
jgi:hypothetical protein